MAEQAGEHRWLDRGFSVGEWFVEPSLNRMTKGEEETSLEPKVMQVLVCLAERPQKTVTKEQFMEKVWGDTVVTNDVLSRCISELRKTLGDDARDPRYIETIRKAGYRLIASVSYVEPNHEMVPTGQLPVRASSLQEEAAVPGWLQQFWRSMPFRLGARQTTTRLWGSVALLLVLLLGGVFWLQSRTLETPPTPPETVPFTSFPGEEFDPALSPDGGQVAFVWDGGDGANFDIYVKQAGMETPLRLTEHPADESSPTWSPDGQRIAFVRTGEGENSVVVVPALGGSERVVASFGMRDIEGLVWSPEGSTLALAAESAPYEAYSIYLLSIETHEKRRLTTPPSYYHGDLGPAFSPDGKAIAFTRSVIERIQDIYMVPVSGGAPERLTHDQSEITGLDWTAKGRSIVFASDRSGTSRLWRLPASGGRPQWVATAGGGKGVHQPSIARDGNRMTLTQRSFDVNIWTLRRLSGYGRFTAHPQILSTHWDSNPDISPDAERVAFASKRSGHFEIWTSRRDGTNPVQLTTFEGPFTSTPRWSPNGQRIAFVARRAGNTDIYTIDASGGTPRRLTRGASDEVAPRWSRDGRWIYFASNRSDGWQIWKMPASGGPIEQVTREGGFAALEAPDSRFLYYVKRNTPGIWRRPILGGEEVRVVDALEPYDWGNWTVTDQGIYYVHRDNGRPMLSYYSFASERTMHVAHLEGMPQHTSLAVAPDAEWFLYAKVDRSESDIMIVENFR